MKTRSETSDLPIVQLVWPSADELSRGLRQLIYQSARTCYSDRPAHRIEPANEADHLRLLQHLYESGHHSVFEHVCFALSIEGISRACTHQLVRHRHTGFSQQSMRYVALKEPKFVQPPGLSDEAARVYQQALESAARSYESLLGLGVPPEDARLVLPEATLTNLVMSTNLRQLMQMMELRLCTLAQWEIRRLFKRIRKLFMGIDPLFGKILVIKCIRMGYCNEQRNSDQHCRIRPYRPAAHRLDALAHDSK